MICKANVGKSALYFFEEDIDHLEPEICCGGFGEKEGPASNYFDKNLNFEAFDGAYFVEFKHFLSPEFGVIDKLGLIFLDVNHSNGLEQWLESHLIGILELQQGFLKMLGQVDIKLELSVGIQLLTKVKGQVPNKSQCVCLALG